MAERRWGEAASPAPANFAPQQAPDDSEIIEGCLCPECHLDLRTPELLLKHFTDVHTEEDKAKVASKLKLPFKRKDKGAKDDGVRANGLSRDASAASASATESDISLAAAKQAKAAAAMMVEYQEPGVTRSHTPLFMEMRARVTSRAELETNKLLNRLERLLDTIRTGKAVDKSVVQWQADREAKACPNCKRPLGLLTRRHHCRLCGIVYCQEEGCTIMLSVNDARKLVDPTGVGAPLKQPDPSAPQPSDIRICKICTQQLYTRGRMSSLRIAAGENRKPAKYLPLYAKLTMMRQYIDELMPQYLAKAHEVNDPTNKFADKVRLEAVQMKAELTRMLDEYDKLSKKIMTCPLPEVEPGGNAATVLRLGKVTERIQSNIRRYATFYLTDQMRNLETLSTATSLTMAKSMAAPPTATMAPSSSQQQIRPSTVAAPPPTSTLASSSNRSRYAPPPTQQQQDSNEIEFPGDYLN